MSCNNCNKDYPIVNKKHNLCGSCNFMRTHDGKSQVEVYSERAALRPQKQYVFKRSVKPIRQQTAKEAGVKSKLADVKKEIELEAIQNGEYYCQGCGKSTVGLDKSHLLSVGEYKELELVKDNIQLMCRGCHIKWESKVISTMVTLHCFWDNMIIIKRLSIEAYNKYVSNIEEYSIWLTTEQKDVVNARLVNV